MFKNYVRVVIALIHQCQNWVEIIAAKLRNTPLQVITTRTGTKIYIGGIIGKADLSMFAEIWYHHFYTPSGFEIKPTDIVFDIGANNGFFSAYAASHATEGKVCAFEPVPELAQKITETKKINTFKNLQVENQAIGAKVSQMTLYISDSHNGCHSLYPRDTTTKEITVPVIDLPTYCKNNSITHIDFLKLDCEGAEYEIITEANKEFIRKHVNKISMEYHDTITSHTHTELVTILKSIGFTVNIWGDYLYAKNTR